MADEQLKRRLGGGLLTLYGLGTTIGAGIYVLVGEVAGIAGYFAPLSFIIAAVLAGFSALSFAELAVRYPVSAGEAAYVTAGLKKPSIGLIVGLMVVAAGSVSSAAIVNGFVGYLDVFVDMPRSISIVLVLALLVALACWGILESVSFASLITAVEIGGLLLIIWVGGSSFSENLPALMDQLPTFSPGVLSATLLGATLAFYAFIGFEDMIKVAEEVKDVPHTMPRAIILTLVVTTVLYVLVSLVAMTALPLEELASREAPLARIYEQSTGNAPYVISIIGILAVLNGALIQIIMASRILYGLARQEHLPKQLAAVHPRLGTPVLATIATGLFVLVMALLLPLLLLAQFTSAITLSIFALVNISLILIKRRSHDRPAFQVPAWVPWFGAISSTIFAIIQIGGF